LVSEDDLYDKKGNVLKYQMYAVMFAGGGVMLQ